MENQKGYVENSRNQTKAPSLASHVGGEVEATTVAAWLTWQR
jgi:hypothetical protein